MLRNLNSVNSLLLFADVKSFEPLSYKNFCHYHVLQTTTMPQFLKAGSVSGSALKKNDWIRNRIEWMWIHSPGNRFWGMVPGPWGGCITIIWLVNLTWLNSAGPVEKQWKECSYLPTHLSPMSPTIGMQPGVKNHHYSIYYF